ncbi:MAG TPA: SpoIVB peptidase [Clostridia bacterium]|jgi:stage IV sporulation protein B
MARFKVSVCFFVAVLLTALIINVSKFTYPIFNSENITADIATSAQIKKEQVYLGGMPIGISIKSQGVIVIGVTNINTAEGSVSPSKEAGIEPGDILTEIAGEPIESVASLDEIINKPENIGEKLILKFVRNNKQRSTIITPACDISSGRYKLGLWIRDSAAGIGTITFMKETKSGYKFGALGHPICDPDTLTMVPVRSGDVYRCSIIGLKKSQKGAPGEIRGVFLKEGKKLGVVEKNNRFGVYGVLEERLLNPLYPNPIEIAKRREVKPGKAKIVSTLDSEIKEYDIEIIKTNNQKTSEEKSMVIRVTDPELIKKTGGIVQGMSGSPIIQNGKLVGAVTHVFINDPTKGFGVYLDWMIDE